MIRLICVFFSITTFNKFSSTVISGKTELSWRIYAIPHDVSFWAGVKLVISFPSISIYGFTNIFSGQIEIDGKEITHLTPAQKLTSCGIAYILQDNSVFPDMTVEENLLMGGYSKENTDESYWN